MWPRKRRPRSLKRCVECTPTPLCSQRWSKVLEEAVLQKAAAYWPRQSKEWNHGLRPAHRRPCNLVPLVLASPQPETEFSSFPSTGSVLLLVKTVKAWPADTIETLKGCYSSTDWDVFHESSEVTTACINVYVAAVTPQKTIKLYPNSKSYITEDVKDCRTTQISTEGAEPGTQQS